MPYDYQNRFDAPFRGLHAYALYNELGMIGRVVVRWTKSGSGCRVWVQFWGGTMAEAYAKSASTMHAKETKAVIECLEQILAHESDPDDKKHFDNFADWPMTLTWLARLINIKPGRNWREHFEAYSVKVQHIL